MRFKKIIIYGMLFFGVLPVIFFSSIQMYLQVSFPEKKTKQIITSFFKKEIKRAVKFDSASLDLLGNVTLNNFELSVANDFNDNLSLVKCQKAYIDLQLIPLLLGRIKIDSIIFSEASILLYKRYGITFEEYMDQFESFIDFSEMIRSDTNRYTDDLHVIFVDSEIVYKEVFKETRTSLTVQDADLQINIRKGKNSFFLTGRLLPHLKGSVKRGEVTINGSENTGSGEGTFSVVIDNLDLSILNNHLAENVNPNASIKGNGSVDVSITTERNKVRVKGTCEADSFQIIALQTPSRALLLNDNVSIRFDVESDKTGDLVKVYRLSLNDDCVDLLASGVYERDKKIKIEFGSNSINLDKLSSYFTPFMNYYFSGTLRFGGAFSIDQKNRKVDKSEVSISASNCSVRDTGRRGEHYLLQNVNFVADMKGNALMINYCGDFGKSDLHIAALTRVTGWFPLQTDTDLSGRMNRLDLLLAGKAAKRIMESLVSSSFEDQKKGYDDEFFLKSTPGIFLNNNDIVADVAVNRIVIDQDWKNIGMLTTKWVLEKGFLSTKRFTLTGGNPQYNFNLFCNLNSDQPYLKFEGQVSGFKIDDYSPKGFSEGFTGGTIDMDFDYELSFYRIANFIENSKGNMTLHLRDGAFKNTSIQKDFSRYFKENGISVPANEFTFKEIKLNIALLAENYYISNTSIQSDEVNAALYGKYTYLDGFEATVNAGIKDAESTYHTVTMSCRGPLLNPCFKLKTAKENRELCVK